MSRLVDQIKQAVGAFAECETPPALIGGLALAVHQVVRATRDVDFLVDAQDADHVHAILLGLGYRCVHRSEDAANYVRGDEGLDVIVARRPIARRLLAEASERATALGPLRVVSAEGLIGFKLQALVNARWSYWSSASEIPGGPSFENFEVVEPFRQGAAFRFSVDPLD